VGEIADEHEEIEPAPEPLPGGGWRLDGGASIETLDELFGIDLGEEPYETVAGLVLSVAGSLPEPGQAVVAHGLRLEVEAVENRRIQTVRVERVAEPAPPAAGEQGERDERARG
jgi:CBS domain containing-hemolysin-like protein